MKGVGEMSKVGIIGVGNVGATVAHVLLEKGLVSELVLLDKKKDKAMSEMLDLQDAGCFFSKYASVTVGGYEELADAEVIISALGHIDLIAADADRFAELKMNAPEVRAVSKELNRVGFKGKLLVITNPCDVMTELYYRSLDLPASSILGTGTVLDTARMKHYVGEAFGVDSRSVSGYVLGEHGDSQFVCWSSVFIGGKSIFDFVSEQNFSLDEIEDKARQSGYHVYAGKGYTNVAIAQSTACVLEALLSDAKSVMPVSHYHKEHDSYISTPAIVGKRGIEGAVKIALNEAEETMLVASVKEVREKSKKFS